MGEAVGDAPRPRPTERGEAARGDGRQDEEPRVRALPTAVPPLPTAVPEQGTAGPGLPDEAPALPPDARQAPALVAVADGLPRQSSFRRGFAVTLGGLVALGLALAARAVASELLLVVVAAFIAIGLEPAVAWLVRLHLRRAVAVALISSVVVALFASFTAAAAPPLISEVQQLLSSAPYYLQQLQDKHTAVGHLNASLHLVTRVRSLTAHLLSLDGFGGLLGVGTILVSYLFQLLVVLVLVVYFLADFPGIKRAAYRLAPLERRPRVATLGDEILSRIGGYVLGNLLTSVVAAVMQYALLRVLGVPFAFALAVLVGVFDLVPMIGSVVAAVVVTTVALSTVSSSAAITNVVFSIVYRLFEDYVLSPRILARTVSVRPAVVVIAVLLGGALLGVEGALIGVPVAAAVQLLVTEVVYARTDLPRTAAAPGRRA